MMYGPQAALIAEAPFVHYHTGYAIAWYIAACGVPAIVATLLLAGCGRARIIATLAPNYLFQESRRVTVRLKTRPSRSLVK